MRSRGMRSRSKSPHSHRQGSLADPTTSGVAKFRGISSNKKSNSLSWVGCLVRIVFRYGLLGCVILGVFWFLFLVQSHRHIREHHEAKFLPRASLEQAGGPLVLPFMKDENQERIESDALSAPDDKGEATWGLPIAFEDVLYRALEKQQHCSNLQNDGLAKFDKSLIAPFRNETVATLPSFGIIDRLQAYKDNPSKYAEGDPENWQCVLPPPTECQEQHLTVVFMAYNPDRLQKTFKEIRKLLEDESWKQLVEEVVLVWNGERSVGESDQGKKLLQYAEHNALRVVYPLLRDLPNDLMNRYHPEVVQVSTKAILFYDDDGPFYSFAAVQGGFELWKRHSQAQIGAMARQISYCSRQLAEYHSLLGTEEADDLSFVSHCSNVEDKVDYNFRYFANYDANMVLPSGSLLHSKYLCFLWHPVLEPVREFVRAHPVHPDDATVSMIVSQLAGRAPRVYSRRLNLPETEKKRESVKTKARRLMRSHRRLESSASWDGFAINMTEHSSRRPQQHRRLMQGINWDAGAGMTDQKQFWADLRTSALNALLRYFGSMNSGSIGWCQGTSFYNKKVDGRCNPVMAKQGWLPWMNPDGTVKETCP